MLDIYTIFVKIDFVASCKQNMKEGDENGVRGGMLYRWKWTMDIEY